MNTLKLFLGILVLLNLSLAAQTKASTPCFAKVSAVDSLSGKLVSQLSLTSNEVILFKDNYKCNCSVQTIRVTVVRERRPLISIFMPGRLSISELQRLMNSTAINAGDRILIEMEKLTESSGAPCKSVSSSQSIILNVVP